MKRLLVILVKSYGGFLHLYPASFREKFEQEMLLDFRDMVEEAGKRGSVALLMVLLRELRDFPLNLLVAHLREGHMSGVFQRGPARGAFQGALALALALITMFTTIHLISTAMYGQGWLFLMRAAKSIGWSLNFGPTAQLMMAYLTYGMGALLGGIILAVCLWETHRIKLYVLAGVLGWAGPLLIVRTIGSLLITASVPLRNTVLDYSWTILAGLGFGAVFSLILRDRRKTLWLLFAGVFGYFIAQNLVLWLIAPLFPTNSAGSFNWMDLIYIAFMYGVMGTVIGATLGAVAGWSKRKTISSAAI
jgi:hypothetical protein